MRDFSFKQLIRNKLFQNFGWITFGQAIQTLLSLIVGALVARHLGPHGFGMLGLAATLVSIATVVANLGLEMVVKKALLDHPSDRKWLLGSAYALKACASFICTGILVIFVLPGGLTQLEQAILFTCGLFLVECGRVVDFWFQSQVQARYSTWVITGSLLVLSVARILLVWQDAGPTAFAATCVLYGFSVHIGFLIMYQIRERDLFQWRFRLETACSFLRTSWPLIFNSINVMLYTRVDQVMLASMGGLEQVGVYSPATRIMDIVMFIPMAISSTLFPKILNSKSSQAQEFYRNNLLRFFRLNSQMAFALTLALVILGPFMIWTLFGEQYHASGGILQILACGCIFKFLICARGQEIGRASCRERV